MARVRQTVTVKTRRRKVGGNSGYEVCRVCGGDYSRNGDMYNRLETMMHEASTDREREAIRRAMEQL